MFPPDEPAVLPLLPLVEPSDNECLSGADGPPEEPTTGTVDQMADTSGGETSDGDPYYGLFTNPPGKWGLVAHAHSYGLVIKGCKRFIELSLNLLHSYIEGLVQRADYFGEGYVLVPMFRERLIKALALWFYGRIFKLKAIRHWVTQLDEDGDEIITDLVIQNDAAMMNEGYKLATTLVASISGCALGCSFSAWEGASIPEQVVGGFVGDLIYSTEENAS